MWQGYGSHRLIQDPRPAGVRPGYVPPACSLWSRVHPTHVHSSEERKVLALGSVAGSLGIARETPKMAGSASGIGRDRSDFARDIRDRSSRADTRNTCAERPLALLDGQIIGLDGVLATPLYTHPRLII